jgi:hypothetical protein
LEELAIDVAEAQIRLFRRERLLVWSLVWDLYGKPEEPLLKACTLPFGAALDRASSQCVYQRVNLRGLGASKAAVVRVRDAIEGRVELSEAERADHPAVLWFVAGAEGLPVQVVRSWISEGRLMESELYRSIFEEFEAKGRVTGDAARMAETIVRILMRRMGELDLAIREKIRGLSDIDTLTLWYEEALDVVDAEGARKLAETIQKASPAQISPR